VSGIINEGIPKGTETIIHGLPTYVARPQGRAKGLVVIVPDAFGWDFSNGRVLADSYAEKGGFLVYLPDFMNGMSKLISRDRLYHSKQQELTGDFVGHSMTADALSLTAKIMKPASWLTTIFYKPFYVMRMISIFAPWVFLTRRSVVKPRIFEFFKSLRTSPPSEIEGLKIGVAGFCWGGQHAILLAHNTPSSRAHRAGAEAGQLLPLIDCAYTAHPSFVAVPKELEEVTVPLSIAVGDIDIQMNHAQALEAKEILEKKLAGDNELIIYPGAQHGFAVRGDPEDPTQVALGEKARSQALSWFGRWLS
jgi:dienelactone hydrolase